MDFDQLFKTLVWDAIVKALVARLFVAIPFLGWGPIGIVVGWVITLVTDKLFDAIKLFINLELIVLRNEAHLRAYQRASSALYIIARDKGIESEDFRRAREEHRTELADFIRFDP